MTKPKKIKDINSSQSEWSFYGFEPEKVELIKNTVAASATPDELKLFLYQCSRTGLDPLARQIYFQKRFNKRRNRSEMTIITGIDGYRLVADRTGQYAGNDDPIFDDESQPRKATVTVYKVIGTMRCPFTASARWDQYYPGEEAGFMWRKMPHLMLGKCAEALALRKAFPAELSGIYIKEEMDQADREDVAQENQDAAQSTEDFNEQRMIYTGSEQQRNYLRQAFARHELKNRDKHKIAALMRNKPMDSLEEIIADYLKSVEQTPLNEEVSKDSA